MCIEKIKSIDIELFKAMQGMFGEQIKRVKELGKEDLLALGRNLKQLAQCKDFDEGMRIISQWEDVENEESERSNF